MIFKKIPNGWASTNLEALGQWGSGGTPSRSKSEYYDGGSIPWLLIGDLNDSIIKKAKIHITQAGIKNSSAKLIPSGAILVAMYGSIGKTAITGIPCTTNQAIAHCIPNKGINLKYLHRAIQWLKPSLIAQGQGGAQQNISQGIIKSQEIFIAPTAEQTRIADKLDAVLSRVDDVNARLARVAPLLKRFRQSVLAAATSGRLTEDWRDSNKFNWNPTSMRLGDTGQIITGSTPPKNSPDLYGKEIPFFKPSDLAHGYEVKTAGEYLSKKGGAASRMLPQKSVLVTCIGATIGKTGLSRSAGATNQQINAVICDHKVMPEWLYFWMSSPTGQTSITENSSATTLPIINKSKFSALPIEVPSIEEQAEIVRRVEILFAFADRLEARLKGAQAAAQRLTPAVLAKAFRGKLVAQDPADEPAAELLKRLAAQRAQAPAGRKSGTSRA